MNSGPVLHRTRAARTHVRHARVSSAVVLVTLAFVLGGCASGAIPAARATQTAKTKSLSGQHLLVTFPGSASEFVNTVATNFFTPFEKATGTTVTTSNASTGPVQLAAEEQSHNVNISDIVIGSVGDGLLAQQSGYLEPLNPKIVPLKLLAPGSYTKYGITAWTYGTVIAWNTHDFPKGSSQPTDITDIFNTTKYTGKRCLYEYPEYGATLESALLASGVSASHLYPLDLTRAFNELDKIKNDIVWWTSGAQAQADLLNGTCSMALYYAGDLYTMAVKDHEPIGIAWGHALYESVVLAIPKGTPTPRASQELIRDIILNNKAQTNMMRTVPYFTVTLKHGDAAVLPNKKTGKWALVGANLKTAFAENAQYYSTHITSVVSAFNSWLVTSAS